MTDEIPDGPPYVIGRDFTIGRRYGVIPTADGSYDEGYLDDEKPLDLQEWTDPRRRFGHLRHPWRQRPRLDESDVVATHPQVGRIATPRHRREGLLGMSDPMDHFRALLAIPNPYLPAGVVRTPGCGIAATPCYTVVQVQNAVSAALDAHQVSLWLQEPCADTMPLGHIHPCDVSHITRWVIEELRKDTP